MRGIIAAQGAHIEQLSQAVNHLSEKVKVLEKSAVRSFVGTQVSEPPMTTRPSNVRHPRRLDPSMIQTFELSPPYIPIFQALPVLIEEYLPTNPPLPIRYRPPYTDIGEEEPDGTPKGHTMSHAAGFTPINCSCALPHTLGNGETEFPRVRAT